MLPRDDGAEPSDASGRWSAKSWVDSVAEFNDELAKALLAPLVDALTAEPSAAAPTGAMEFAYMRSLADAPMETIEKLLVDGNFLHKLARAICGTTSTTKPTGLQQLKKQRAASAYAARPTQLAHAPPLAPMLAPRAHGHATQTNAPPSVGRAGG